MQVILSAQAEKDLLSIWKFIATDNPVAADHYLDALDAGILKLAEFPELGIQRHDLLRELRCLTIERHLIFYLNSTSSIRIVRILHQAMDYRVKF